MSSRYGDARTLLVSSTGIGVTFTLQALTGPGWQVSWFVVATLLAGFCMIVSYILQVSTRQQVCPPAGPGQRHHEPRRLGRRTTGQPVCGVLGTVFGLHATLWIASLASLVGTAFLYFSPFRTLPTIPAVPPADARTPPPPHH